jgi:transcriptional regulator with XRE-family HTH domain
MSSSTRALIRKQSGLTQRKLAKLTGIHYSLISSWENGDIEFSPERVAKIGSAIAEQLGRIPVMPTTSADVVRALVEATA